MVGLGRLRVVDLVNGTCRIGKSLDLSNPLCPCPRLLCAANAGRDDLTYRLDGAVGRIVVRRRGSLSLALTTAGLHEFAQPLDALLSCETRVCVRPGSV